MCSRGVPRDGVLLQKRNGVANRDCGAGGGSALRGGLFEREGVIAQPEAFNKPHDAMRTDIEDRRTALAFYDGMAEKKYIRGRSGVREMRRFVGENRAGGRIFALELEAIRALQPLGMQREREDGFSLHGRLGRQRKKRHLVFAGEWIRRDAKNRDVVRRILRDDAGLQQLRRSIDAIDENVRLAAVAERFEDMRNGEQITLVVDEEGVAEECVVVAARSGALIVRINNGAKSRSRRIQVGFVRRLCRNQRKPHENADNRARQDGSQRTGKRGAGRAGESAYKSRSRSEPSLVIASCRKTRAHRILSFTTSSHDFLSQLSLAASIHNFPS